MTCLVELPVPDTAAANAAVVARHNIMVRKGKSDNDLKRAQLAAGLMAVKNNLA